MKAPASTIKALSHLLCLALLVCTGSNAQHVPALYKVLTLTGQKTAAQNLPHDNGLTGTWQKLQKLQTTASLMHTQAHPDDEHADLLTYFSRGKGVRTALLSLNRGESGGNVLGVEFFDQLGLLRTEEFLLAAAHYGLDDLYFTRLVDYGFSKRVEEAYDKWGKEKVLEELVRAIRINRPLVLISRFHGSSRDGHGNHQAVGETSQQAFDMAGEANAFPQQISKEGLRPWKPLKLYRGGVRQNEHWNIALNTGVYNTWLGDTYKNFSLLGYSFHRSQFGGVRRQVNGPSFQYYERLQMPNMPMAEQETDFFNGIDTSIPGIPSLTGEAPPAALLPVLNKIADHITNAVNNFKTGSAEAVLAHLANGLSATRAAIQIVAHLPETRFHLQIKEQQFVDAIISAAGLKVQAVAVPASSKEKRSPFEPDPVMGFAVPEQSFAVEASLVNYGSTNIQPTSFQLIDPGNQVITSLQQPSSALAPNEQRFQRVSVKLAANTPFTKPYFTRNNLNQNIYNLEQSAAQDLPWATPALRLYVSCLINGQAIGMVTPVQVKQPDLPYGYRTFSLKVAPAIGVSLQPVRGILPVKAGTATINAEVEVVNNLDTVVTGQVRLTTPAGWIVQPAQIPLSFNKPGEKGRFDFKITLPTVKEQTYEFTAAAQVNGTTYNTGYEVISHRDVDQVLMHKPAIATVKGIRVKLLTGLRIGYIMGVGDEVPAGLEQLGATVQLLNATEMALTTLHRFDVIMIGTRAYAVRKDLLTYNQQLLDYARQGGHLIVLFQTPEFVPELMAAHNAQLPGNSEEVSEEDSPVTFLQPHHRVLNFPNTITKADFNGWVEQRGSKFFSSWDSAYVPIISTHDVGQAPQSGGWLMAQYGKGYYTYCAYSFHRQLPYAVPGAYRIMANLVSYGGKRGKQ